MGAVPAYLLSALIPVGWVLVDLFFLSRRFNFITAFLGLNAIVRGCWPSGCGRGDLAIRTRRQHPIVRYRRLILLAPHLGAFVAQAPIPAPPQGLR